MRRLPLLLTWASLAVSSAAPALASGEDADLDLVPDAARIAPPAETAPADTRRWRWDVSETLQFNRYRDVVVPAPNTAEPSWSNLLRLSARGDSPLSDTTRLVLDAQLNAYANEGSGFDGTRDLRVDIKEAYVSHAPDPAMYVDVGRIVVRSGVAYGFNPTDIFRVNAVVNRTTEDPGALRNGRMGALLARTQFMWDGGTVGVVASPRIGADAGRWWTDADVIGLNLNATNDRSRLLVRLSQRIAGDVTPELVAGVEGGDPLIGVSASAAAGDAVMLYGEWLGSRRFSLYDEAMGIGRPRFIQQAALGFSWSSDDELTANVEYHHNGAGMTGDQWRRWFDDGSSGDARSRGRLWSVRGLARDRQEPASRHALFLRLQRSNAFTPDLTLTGLAMINPMDWGRLVQVEAGYAVSPSTTIAARASWTGGRDRSERGGTPRAGTLALELATRL